LTTRVPQAPAALDNLAVARMTAAGDTWHTTTSQHPAASNSTLG
jgi:hypothetical protein